MRTLSSKFLCKLKIEDYLKIKGGLKGLNLWARGRNPNRKQFITNAYRSHEGLRQSIPLKYSTYISLYLKGDDNLDDRKVSVLKVLDSLMNHVNQAKATSLSMSYSLSPKFDEKVKVGEVYECVDGRLELKMF